MFSFFKRRQQPFVNATLQVPPLARRETARINYRDPDAIVQLQQALTAVITSLAPQGSRLEVACIGSDRCTGDALGPLVGSKLALRGIDATQIVGTLANPLHAGNLMHYLITRQTAPCLAVDACLGQSSYVGTIAVGIGPLFPGAAVQKRLPPVGDLYLTATVNAKGANDHLVLQHTRLYLVNAMAEVIAAALSACLLASFPKPL